MKRLSGLLNSKLVQLASLADMGVTSLPTGIKKLSLFVVAGLSREVYVTLIHLFLRR